MAVINGHLRTTHYFDNLNSGVNIIAPYQCVQLLDAAEVAATTGAIAGTASKAAEVGATAWADRVVGISEHGAKHNTSLSVRNGGIAHVMAGAAITYGKLLSVGVVEQRTNSQTPLINLYEANLPVEPGVGVTYTLAMVDDVAYLDAALVLPVGYALNAAAAKYEIIDVELALNPFVTGGAI